MADINNCTIVGRLTNDVELRKTQDGKSVVSFSIACNRDKEHADYINCVAWQGTADVIANYFKKGHRIGLIGRWQTRNYKDQSNRTVYVNELLVRELMFLESKRDNSNVTHENTTHDNLYSQNQNVQNNYGFEGDTLDISNEDLPF